MLAYVAAVAKNKVIGKDNRLPWYLPNDLQFFRRKTLSGSKTMIMGRRTFESLPKVLPGRKHIIITQNKDYHVNDENVQVVHTIDDLMPYVDTEEEYFVIGGAKIFKMLFPYTQRMYITEIHEDFVGDTVFPDYEQAEWKVTEKKEGIIDEKNIYKHTFLTLDRI